MHLEVRPARMEDALTICRVHQGSVETYFRYPAEGPRVPVAQEELDEEGLWLNGGPWMVPALCQAHMRWLLGGAGLAWVGLLDGEIVGEGEAFLSLEPPPLGRYLDLSVLYVHRRAQRRGVGSALLEEILARAAQERCDTILIGGGVDAPDFYSRFGFAPWQDMVLARADSLPGADLGRPFEPGDYGQVAGLPMPLGRRPSARQVWEESRGPDALPPSRASRRRDWRLLQPAEEAAWTVFVADVFDPTRVSVHVWSRAAPAALLPWLLAEAGALGYAQADLLLEEAVFTQLEGRHRLSQAGRHQAWWRPLTRPPGSQE